MKNNEKTHKNLIKRFFTMMQKREEITELLRYPLIVKAEKKLVA